MTCALFSMTCIVVFAILSACAALSDTLEAAAESSVAAVATCSTLLKPELALLLVSSINCSILVCCTAKSDIFKLD
ncbi:hypothetical protein O9992_13410 [Vibrio lentus]|nr:hypothetical protein [Vibrio lentus]